MKARVYVSNKLAGGLASLEIRLVFGGVKYQLFISGLKVPLEYFDNRSQRMKAVKGYPQYKAVNNLLNTICNRLEESLLICIENKASPNKIRTVLRDTLEEYTGHRAEQRELSIKSAFTEFLAEKEKTSSINTVYRYHNLIGSLFGGKKQKSFESFLGRKLKFQDFDKELAGKYQDFLLESGKSNSTVKVMFTQLKAFLNWAAKEKNYVDSETPSYFITKLKSHDEGFSLTETEFQTLANADLGHESEFFRKLEGNRFNTASAYIARDNLENTRNLIVFMVATAQRPSDVINRHDNGLKWSHITSENGFYSWKIYQHKVQGTFINLPLEGLALKALNDQSKYNFEGGFVFSPVSIQRYSVFITELFKLLNLDRVVRRARMVGNQSEVIEKPLYDFFRLKHARSTGATFYNTLGGSSMARFFTGHKSEGVTQKHYIARQETEMRKAAKSLSGEIDLSDLDSINQRIKK